MSKGSLEKAPSLYRSDVARGLAAGSEVSKKGGRYGAGLIEGFAVITRGEALGHGLWIDREFIASVDAAMSGARSGVKSRFTHPDLSGDGLAKGLGRVYWRKSESEDIARGDLHLWESSRKSPDGDLGGYVLTRADEDPESFGASISFAFDVEATKAHFLANGGKIKIGEYGEQIWDASEFRSTDPLNVGKLPHARLAELRAVDIVDDPAANPDGLFHRDETLKSAESLLEYALGLSDRKPEIASFGIDPDRAGGFVRRFLNSRGLSLMKLKGLNEAGVLADDAPPKDQAANVEDQEILDEEGAQDPVSETEPKTDEEKEGDSASPPASENSALSAREECRRFVDAFGAARGAEWFASGLSFDAALEKFAAELKAENEKLRKQLKAAASAESAPLSSGGADEQRSGSKSGAGFASRIRFSTPSRN